MSATPPLIVPELPKAADMLERVRAEAAELRSFTITFLSLLLYVAIIISSTTHEQILRIDPVKQPLLGVDIPIVGFYWFMPGFLFFLHLYILLQHYLFSQLAFRFRAALERETDEETKNHLRRSLGNLPFLHWLAGQHTGFMNFLMTAITVVSLIIWPAWTFWWLQAAFLPYHDNTIVWTQRAFLFLDAALVAYLWAKILDDQDDAGHWWQPWLAPFFYDLTIPFKAVVRWVIRWLNRLPWLAALAQRQWHRRIINWLRPGLGNGADAPTATVSNPATLPWVLNCWLLSAFLLVTLFFSFFVSTIPDSAEEQWLLARLPDTVFLITKPREEKNHRLFTLTALLHEQRRKLMTDDELNDYDPNRISECSETKEPVKKAAVTDAKTANNMPEIKPELPQKCYWIDSPFPRNLILREKLLVANKDLAAEVQAGLAAAASTTKADVLGVGYIRPGTTKADDLAKALGLSLQGRHLEYADFSDSSLPNVDLRRARLKAANLHRAKLEKANLSDAVLPGANLSSAQLPGADLSSAQLPGANLSWAHLPGANLFRAQLPGADLSYAELSGVILENINVAPMNKEEVNAETDKLFNALKDLPQYHEVSGQAALRKEKDRFRQKITRSVDFSKIKGSKDCLADESPLKYLTSCKKIGDSEAKKSAYEIWARLACEDSTEKNWVAQRMFEQAISDDRFPDFAALLAAKLQTPAKCPGLAGLDDQSKKILLDAARKTPWITQRDSR